MIPENEFYLSLGRAIKARREALNLTQSALAAQMGLSRTSITNIERGRQRLLIDQFCRIAGILRCDHGLLLKGLLADSVAPQGRTSNLEAMPATVVEFVEALSNEKTN